jgi:L-iditol 2-dehydrogenase
MKWLTCLEDGRVSLVDGPAPAIGPGELLVKLRACGVCGTDVSKVYTPGYPRPTKLGHEVVGEIVEVGPGVERLRGGQRVAFAHHVPDYASHYSRRGSESMDSQFKRTNLDPGGFAELIRVPALHVQYNLLPVPAAMPDLRAIFMEPLACCLRALDRVKVQEGDTALIVGVGAIGILFVPLLRDRSVRTLATDVRMERLEAAREWDVRLGILQAGEDIPALCRTQTEGRGADLVILTAANPATFAMSFAAVRDGGSILFFGGKPGTTLSFDEWDLLTRELNLVTSYSSTPAVLHRAMAILASDAYAVERMVDPVLPLDQAARGFELVHEALASKVAIVP